MLGLGHGDKQSVVQWLIIKRAPVMPQMNKKTFLCYYVLIWGRLQYPHRSTQIWCFCLLFLVSSVFVTRFMYIMIYLLSPFPSNFVAFCCYQYNIFAIFRFFFKFNLFQVRFFFCTNGKYAKKQVDRHKLTRGWNRAKLSANLSL